LKFGHAVLQDVHDDVPNTFGVFEQLSCEATWCSTPLPLIRGIYWLEAGTIGKKSADKSVG
jgi:hypothetical protein